MMKTVLLIGTEPTMCGIAQKLQKEGVESLVAPLLGVTSVRQPILPVDKTKVDAILLTSPNAAAIMHHMLCDSSQFCWMKKTTVIAIGRTTAVAAYPKLKSGDKFPDHWWIGDRTNATLETLMTRWQQRFFSRYGRMPVVVHMCGDKMSESTHQALSVVPITVKRWVVYRVVMIKEWSQGAWQHIAGSRPIIIAVHSVNAAQALASMVAHAGAHYGLDGLEKISTARHVVLCCHHDVYRVVKHMPWSKIVLTPYQSSMVFALAKQSMAFDTTHI